MLARATIVPAVNYQTTSGLTKYVLTMASDVAAWGRASAWAAPQVEGNLCSWGGYLMNGCPVALVHLVKLVNAADALVCQDQCTTLQYLQGAWNHGAELPHIQSCRAYMVVLVILSKGRLNDTGLVGALMLRPKL